MSDHSELKKAAEAAPSGPWIAENDSIFFKDDGYTRHLLDADSGHDVEDDAYYAALHFIATANPSAVLSLLDQIEAQQARIIELAQAANAPRDEAEALWKDRTDWQKECLKRGFDYVRESDDHYVLADVPEMADLLGAVLGVEVRSKDNDAYEEANSRLNEQIEGLINTVHAQESLRKDAERYRWLRATKKWNDAADNIPMSEDIWIIESRDDADNRSGEALDFNVDYLMEREKQSV